MSQRIGNVDARERVLGHLARSIAVTLMGKHKPIYDPAVDAGDYVVVTNASQVAVTGKKTEQKLYRHHTMYPGGLKEIPFNKLLESKPEQVIRRAVSGMLPKNKLRERRLERLKIFPGESHPYADKYVDLLTQHRAALRQRVKRPCRRATYPGAPRRRTTPLPPAVR